MEVNIRSTVQDSSSNPKCREGNLWWECEKCKWVRWSRVQIQVENESMTINQSEHRSYKEDREGHITGNQSLRQNKMDGSDWWKLKISGGDLFGYPKLHEK